MSTEGSSRSSSISADSYIGSWISLTSKSEIRYEGILYNINTDESSIGLRNVRSYGSEGRKKDALQVPPSDKVFEYILFRGSDIKDLQVKSSPPVQPASSINNDPAIIQSHYSRPPSTSTSFPSAVSGPITDISSHTAQLGLHGSNFQGSPSLFQPGGNLGSWSPSPSLSSANGSGLAMPMYWQGFYGHPNGLPHLQQQSLLRSQPGLPMPLQQPMQFSGFNSSLPTGTSNLSGAGLLEVPSSFVPTNPSAPNLASPLLPPSALLSAFPPVLPGSLLSDSITNNNQNSSPSTATLCTSLPTLSSLTTMASDLSAVVPPLSNKPNAIGSTLPYQSLPQNSSSAIGAPSTTFTEAPTPTPTLVTPGQLVQFGSSTASSSQTSQTAHKDVEVVRVSSLAPSEPPLAVPVDTKAPILPLPTPPRPLQKPNGAHFDTRHDYRGRGRGRGGGRSRPVTRFTEDFDFTAMNEKFKKDEVWGHLGKSSGSQSEYREGGGKASYEEDFQNEDDSELAKPTYNKDDFFDTLSCNALDRNSNSGRTNFSEQRKIDTETFGEFSTYRGGRGPYRGGRSRGSYYGRGYGYFNRGRGGRGVASRAP